MDEVRIRDGNRVGRVEYDDRRNQPIEGGGGVCLPQQWVLRITVADSAVQLHYEVLDGVPTPRAITIDPVSRPALNIVAKRLAAWTELCERALMTTERRAVLPIPDMGVVLYSTQTAWRDGAPITPDEEARRITHAARVVRDQRAVTRDQLVDVAEVYSQAPRGRKHAAVMEHFSVGKGRANLLIRRAREARLIEKTSQGRAAE